MKYKLYQWSSWGFSQTMPGLKPGERCYEEIDSGTKAEMRLALLKEILQFYKDNPPEGVATSIWKPYKEYEAAAKSGEEVHWFICRKGKFKEHFHAT